MAKNKATSQKAIKVVSVDSKEKDNIRLKYLLSLNVSFLLVAQFRKGKEALSMCSEIKPDIVIISRYLDDIDDIELLKILVKYCKTTGFIMMSVADEIDWTRQAMLVGVRFFLVKPLTTKDLYGTISRVHELMQQK